MKDIQINKSWNKPEWTWKRSKEKKRLAFKNKHVPSAQGFDFISFPLVKLVLLRSRAN